VSCCMAEHHHCLSLSGRCSAQMQALQDSGWAPQTEADREATGVVLGNGMSAIAEIAEAGAVLVRPPLPITIGYCIHIQYICGVPSKFASSTLDNQA
jgi:hypothetical protein